MYSVTTETILCESVIVLGVLINVINLISLRNIIPNQMSSKNNIPNHQNFVTQIGIHSQYL